MKKRQNTSSLTSIFMQQIDTCKKIIMTKHYSPHYHDHLAVSEQSERVLDICVLYSIK